VLLYRAAISTNGSDPATNFERAFASNGWPPQWRAGVFDYQHRTCSQYTRACAARRGHQGELPRGKREFPVQDNMVWVPGTFR